LSNAIFFHIATLGKWKEICQDIFEKIERSGLIDEVSKIYVGLVGNEPFNFGYKKIEVMYRGDLKNFEFLTIERLLQFSKQNPEAKVLYIHTKGVTNDVHPIEDWRNYMAYFVIEQYKICLEKLDEFDVCGVDWVEKPSKHFSGNFWWANASYLNSLPEDWKEKSILTKRHNCEFLIGMNNKVRSCSLHNSNINVYERHLHLYKRENYEFRRTCD